MALRVGKGSLLWAPPVTAITSQSQNYVEHMDLTISSPFRHHSRQSLLIRGIEMHQLRGRQAHANPLTTSWRPLNVGLRKCRLYFSGIR